MANDLIVRILGDTKGLERSFARANQASVTFGRNVETTGAKVDKATRSFKGFAVGAGAGFAGAVAAGAALQQVRASVDVASNLAEQIAKTNVVFGRSADEIKAWATTTADNIGIANDQALAAASTFGAMFDQAGASEADAARFSRTVTQLAADLASFNNTSIDDSLTALRSGLSGEIEPLRRFQVFLTEAAVSQRALEDSNKSSVKQLTQGEKILARYNLILEQTTKQQGDFERTSDGLANKQRILSARFRDAQADLGRGLMPVMETLVDALSDAATGVAALSDGLSKLAGIKVPLIEIPIKFAFPGQGSDADVTLGRIARFILETNVISVTKDVIDIWDDSWTEQVPKMASELGRIQEEAISAALRAAGQFGITPLPTRGENLGRQFASGIAGAIEAAQALAARTIKVGKARIAAKKAAESAAKAREEAEKAAERELARRRAARAKEQARQFRALGLSTTGDEIIPGVKNLQQRIQGALRRIDRGEIDVSSKLVDRLKLARKLIKKEGGDLTEDTRRVINDLIRTVTQGTKSLEDKGGPLTKSMGLNVQKVLEGMGLSPEVERELRARLSGVNTAGRQLAGNTRPTGSFRVPGGATETTVNVNLDGQQIASSVTKNQQKTSRRNPKQKRGPRSGV